MRMRQWVALAGVVIALTGSGAMAARADDLGFGPAFVQRTGGSSACDALGRCVQIAPAYPPRQNYYRNYPPYGGYAYPPQGYNQQPRFIQRGGNVLCDQGTSICYKNGMIDRSETRDAFGDSAADRADDVRDRVGRGDVFVGRGGFVCDPRGNNCVPFR